MLYATAEGNYEFYRNGRLVWKRPATLGRNEVSYLDLPGGYYPLEIRLVDRNGNVLNRNAGHQQPELRQRPEFLARHGGPGDEHR